MSERRRTKELSILAGEETERKLTEGWPNEV